MILVLFLVVAGGIFAVMALFIDFTVVFMTRDQASTAAQAAAHRGLQEVYAIDYGAAFAFGAPFNWSFLARNANRRLIAIHKYDL